MKATVKLAWQLLHVPGLVFMALAVGPSIFGDERAVWRACSWTGATSIVVGIRALQFAKLRIRPVLPNGYRTLTCALALIAGLWLLVIGAALSWTNQDPFLVPLAVIFVTWTVLALGVFTWQLSIVFRLALPFLMLSTLLVLPVLAVGRNAATWGPMLVAGAALAAAAAWIFMLAVEKLPRSPDRLMTETGTGWPAYTKWVSSQYAMLTLLHSGRRALNRSPAILALALLPAWGYHVIVGNRVPFENRALLISCVVHLAASLVLAYSLILPGSARLLWLHSGASRAQLFGIAERTVIRYAIVVLTGWVATGLAFSRHFPADATQAGLALAAMIAAVLASLYLGLMLLALRTWRQVIAGTALLFAWFAVPQASALAFDLRGSFLGPIDPAMWVALVAGVLLLRFVARWIWLNIDWARVRPMLNTRY